MMMMTILIMMMMMMMMMMMTRRVIAILQSAHYPCASHAQDAVLFEETQHIWFNYSLR